MFIIPKSYHRFQGVIEKLFQEKKIISKNELLLDMKEQTFSELIEEINPSKVLLVFLLKVELSSYQKIASTNS